MEAKLDGSISSLPVDVHPGYSVRKAMEKFTQSASRLQPVLKPSFFRRILGGVNSDYARSVSAACNEDARLVRAIVQEAARVAMNMEKSRADTERDRGKVLSGTCRRILDRLDEWRETATDFEANQWGSKKKLIELNKRLMQFVREIEHPAAGLQ
jgi:hypothetical protein